MITNKEAITYFKRHLDLYCVDGISRESEEMAIKALEQEPCEDAVSRAKAIEICKSRGHDNSAHYISELPPVTPQPKTGKFVAIDDTHSQCGECGAIFCISSSGEWEVNYCPNCGTKMEGEKV